MEKRTLRCASNLLARSGSCDSFRPKRHAAGTISSKWRKSMAKGTKKVKAKQATTRVKRATKKKARKAAPRYRPQIGELTAPEVGAQEQLVAEVLSRPEPRVSSINRLQHIPENKLEDEVKSFKEIDEADIVTAFSDGTG